MSLLTNSTTLLRPSKLSPPLLHPHTASIATHFTQRRSRRCNLLRVSSSPQNPTATIAEPVTTTQSDEANGDGGDESILLSGSSVVRAFYAGINSHDLDSVEELIAHNCVYEDLIFPQPFVGRKAIMDFFNKFIDTISMELQFVIDDISEADSSAVGVTWHLEWKGRPFPFSKGCSFYRLEVLNGKRQIIYGRDSVEPFLKPGETALVAIRGVAWLLQRFPKLADWL